MSWIDDLKTPLTIKTGDGKSYSPLWVPTKKQLGWQTTEFEYIDVPGAFVDRKLPKARRFPLDFVFTGDNHLVDAQAFETSANDPRPWTITHPYYGQLIVQPSEMDVDHTGYNVSRFTGTVVETITDQYPKGTDIPAGVISNGATNTNTALAYNYGTNAKPAPTDVVVMQNARRFTYTTFIAITPPDIAAGMVNDFNRANAAINRLLLEPLKAIQQLQQVIFAPAQLATSAPGRVTASATILQNYSNYLRTTTVKSVKQLYEAIGGTALTAMAYAASTPLAGDYRTRRQVLAIADQLTASYALYLSVLDAMQTASASNPGSFVPSADGSYQLHQLISFTLSNLFNIASNARQERTFILEEDSNCILLTHRLYGLQADDSTLDLFMDQNNIGINELLLIRKGRKITYYVQ